VVPEAVEHRQQVVYQADVAFLEDLAAVGGDLDLLAVVPAHLAQPQAVQECMELPGQVATQVATAWVPQAEVVAVVLPAPAVLF
jgi:hypothetical protein